MSKILEDEDLMEIASLIDCAARSFQINARVALTGGEPFTRPDVLFMLLDFFQKSQSVSHVGILTNGTLISDDIASELKRYSKLKEVQISLDGARASTHDCTRGVGAYDRTMRGVEVLRRHDIFTSAMFTLTSINQHDAIDVIQLANDISINAITIERVTPSGPRCSDSMSLPSSTLREIYSSIGRIKMAHDKLKIKIRTCRTLWTLVEGNLGGGFCPVGFSCLTILHDGTLLPCRRLPIPIGNVLVDGIFKPWYTSPVLWELRDVSRLNMKCRKCKFLNSCRGCRAAAYAAGNGMMGEDPSCWIS